MTTVYVSIGNSDDKLTQREWAAFYREVNLAIHDRESAGVGVVHGQWVSEPASAWQNACWCVEVVNDGTEQQELKQALRDLAANYGQDSIAWAVAFTEFLRPPDE